MENNNMQGEQVVKEEYKSLFEYLGKPAGSKLGQQVFKYAKSFKIKVIPKQLANDQFPKVMTYPITLLTTYFINKAHWENNKQYFE